MGEIVRRLQDAGVVNARTVEGGKQVLFNWIRKGKLKLRQRPHSGYYLANYEEMQEIIKAFSYGGKGKWHFQPQTEKPVEANGFA